MRCAILADIHANLAALTAVLNDIKLKGAVDEIWCLGDIVGYGPDPNECISLLKKLKAVCVAGNHDLGAVGNIELSYFNPAAAQACEWTAGQLNPVDARWLEDLPKTVQKGDFLLVHGSPSSHLFEYVLSISIAAKNFEFFDSCCCMVGHTHVPQIFKEEGAKVSTVAFSSDGGITLGEQRMIINPGAVGQPRDGDPRASYAIFDSEFSTLRLFRVPYDVRATQDKMVQVGLPITLVMRLEAGK